MANRKKNKRHHYIKIVTLILFNPIELGVASNDDIGINDYFHVFARLTVFQVTFAYNVINPMDLLINNLCIDEIVISSFVTENVTKHYKVI